MEALFNLAREKFKRLLEEKENLKEQGIRVNVIGQRSRLPQDLQDLIREAQNATKDNNKRTLNVAFSYTSREEMTQVWLALASFNPSIQLPGFQAVRWCAQGVEKGILEPEDITEDLLERCLYTKTSALGSHVDLLVRTSGEVR